MFDQVFDSLQKATTATVQMQQEMFKKWVSLWPGVPTSPKAAPEEVQQFQRKWAQAVSEQFKRQREFIEAQFKVGMENLEKAFALGEAKDPEEVRARTRELWEKSFESLRQAYEAQLREIQVWMDKWFELTTRNAA